VEILSMQLNYFMVNATIIPRYIFANISANEPLHTEKYKKVLEGTKRS